MKRNRDRGFTLIELIMVILILALLAAVALPAYTGYVDRANATSDLQLLSAVNTAFSAACAAHGIDARSIGVGKANLVGEQGNITGIWVDDGVSQASAIENDFNLFFGTNSARRFGSEVDPGEDFVLNNGVFVPVAYASVLAVKYNKDDSKYTLILNRADLSNLKNSNLVGANGSTSTLLQTLNDLVTITTITGNASETIKSDDYKNFADSLGLSEEDAGNSNALVLYAASNVDTIRSTDYIEALKRGEGVYSTIKGEFKKGNPVSGEDIIKAACEYSLSQIGYVNYLNGHGLSQSEYTYSNYLNSDNAVIDMNAFISSMNLIKDNLDSTEMAQLFIYDGFSDLASTIDNAMQQ